MDLLQIPFHRVLIPCMEFNNEYHFKGASFTGDSWSLWQLFQFCLMVSIYSLVAPQVSKLWTWWHHLHMQFSRSQNVLGFPHDRWCVLWNWLALHSIDFIEYWGYETFWQILIPLQKNLNLYCWLNYQPIKQHNYDSLLSYIVLHEIKLWTEKGEIPNQKSI